MRFLIQRVDEASVTVDDRLVGSIGKGYLIFVGISQTDTEEIADKMLQKTCNLHLFEDENGKTNLNIAQVDGQLLIVSQFTLYANCKKGNRPSFTLAAKPDHAEAIYEYILKQAKEQISHVQSGEFGEHMQVSIMNHGPFTVLLDSDEIFA